MNTSTQPWLQVGEDLAIVPSQHGSLACAEAVWETCEVFRPEKIAVELPGSYQSHRVLQGIRDFGPRTGIIVVPKAEQEFADVPINSYPGFPDTERRAVRPATGIPISPSDSIIAAVRAPDVLSRHLPAWKTDVVCIDDEPSQEQPEDRTPVGATVDPYAIHALGMQAWYEQLLPTIRKLPVSRIDQRRNMVMASRLRTLLATGARVLAVVGAAHVEPIRDLLQKQHLPQVPPAPQQQSRNLIIRQVGPRAAWLLGWLDELPRLVALFEEHLRRQPHNRFDVQTAFDRMHSEAIAEGRKRGLPVTSRRLEALQHLLQIKLAVSSRWTPHLDTQLVDIARSAVDLRFGPVIKEVALRYECGGETRCPFQTAEIRINQLGEVFLDAGQQGIFRLPHHLSWGWNSGNASDEPSSRRSIEASGIGPLPMTKAEKAAERRLGRAYRSYPPDTKKLTQMCRRGRDLAHRQLEAHSELVTPFHGSLGLGIDIRKSIQARIRHPEALYVRQPSAERSRHNCCGDCPVVWLFSEKPASHRENGYWPMRSAGHFRYVYSSLYALHGRRSIGGGVTQWQLAYSLIMLRGLAPFEDAAVQSVLRNLPDHRICRTNPDYDKDLEQFSGMARFIACAVKYAGDHVVVANLCNAQIDEGVKMFARNRGVRLLWLSRDDFAPLAIQRIRFDHTVPCPGGRFSAPYPHVDRFIDAATSAAMEPP